MSILLLVVVCLAGATALAMWRSPLWAWAVGAALAAVLAITGALGGQFAAPDWAGAGVWLAFLPALVLGTVLDPGCSARSHRNPGVCNRQADPSESVGNGTGRT